MKSVKLYSVKKEHINSDYVFLDDAFLLMFPKTIISQRLYKNIESAGIHNIFTSGSFEQNVDIDQTSVPSDEEKLAHQIAQGHSYLKNKLQRYYDIIIKMIDEQRIINQQALSFEPINKFIFEEIYQEIKKYPHLYLLIVSIEIQDVNPYILLSIKNMLFTLASVEVGPKTLLNNTTKAIEMSTATLLLDIGVLLLTKRLSSGNKITEIDIRNTKIVGIISQVTDNILRRSFIPPVILSMVDEIHKCMQINQYKPSPRIANFIKYAHITCTYTFLTTDLPGHPAKSPLQALQYLITNAKKIYPPEHLNEFVNALGYIPPSSYVELNNKTKGFVLMNQPENLKAPLVQVLIDVDGKPKTTIRIISTEPKDFGVKRAVPLGKQIKYLESIRMSMK